MDYRCFSAGYTGLQSKALQEVPWTNADVPSVLCAINRGIQDMLGSIENQIKHGSKKQPRTDLELAAIKRLADEVISIIEPIRYYSYKKKYPRGGGGYFSDLKIYSIYVEFNDGNEN